MSLRLQKILQEGHAGPEETSIPSFKKYSDCYRLCDVVVHTPPHPIHTHTHTQHHNSCPLGTYFHFRGKGEQQNFKKEIVQIYGKAESEGLRFPGGSVIKNPPANAGDEGSIPGLGRSPGGGNVNPFQSSCLENPMDRGAWRATVHGVRKESDTTERAQ